MIGFVLTCKAFHNVKKGQENFVNVLEEKQNYVLIDPCNIVTIGVRA